MKEKNNEGITLVALVVTIVVLLILAGITIVYVFGDNGVFQKAQEAKNKTENAIEDEKTYMNDIGNKVDKYTNGIGNGGTTEPIISSSSSTSHTATEIDYTWEKINQIAQVIAKSESINSETMEVTVDIEGTEYTIGVGDIARVKYKESETSEVERRVRVLGFKHDDLVNKKVYGAGTTATKAGISFEFYDFMTGDTYMQMNPKATNSDGWADTQMRKDLNGYATSELEQGVAIGGLGAKLSNREYIKQVKKQYIKTYNDASSNNQYANDYLWLLAWSEIVNEGYSSGYYGYAKTTEGSQYKYYQGLTGTWSGASEGRKKYYAPGSAGGWWLRSPSYNISSDFCIIYTDGNGSNIYNARTLLGVAPGFCI